MPDSQSPSSPQIPDGLLTRLGQVSCPDERTFWFIGHRQSDFEAIADLVEAMMARHRRLGLLFTAPQAETRAWLQARYPRATVLPPPLPLALSGGRYIANLNVRALMILGAPAPGDRAVLRAANLRATPTIVGECPSHEAPGPESTSAETPTAEVLGALPERVEHHFVASQASLETLRQAGINVARVSLLAAEGEARRSVFTEETARLLAQDLKLIRSKQRPIRRRLERLALKAMDSPRWRRRLAFKARRFDTIEALRAELGDPQTILCLGNGPTSEDPAVGQVAYDSLFRVNFLWIDRGFLTRPDMVFTGAKETFKKVRGTIFALQSIRSEGRLLVTRILSPWFPAMRYVTIERFGLFSSERLQGVRPTNGAAMLEVAVALQPARLMISGIDLFSHPAGTYPGDTKTPNAYTPGHNPDSELALLLDSLSRYKGELTILSPALREQWEAFRQAGPQDPENRARDTG